MSRSTIEIARRERTERKPIRRPIGRGQRSEQTSVKRRRAARGSRASRRPALRAHRRANLKAPSFASAPELQKNTFDGERMLDERRGESLARLRRVQVRDVNQAVGRGVQAARRPGSPYPSALTAIPLTKSR